ncbi:MAG: sigma-70 family RNA polymerase sigma factor [Candidatus Hydrogenedentes bacterium]|nr:sigma-70 family RNA polymerase sigma factor [Candidatus Hydrogenedentota bacterium]
MHNGFVEHLRVFYESTKQELFVYALALTGQFTAAEDAVHSAFSGVLRRGKTPTQLRPYMFRCVRNAAMDERRLVERETREASVFGQVSSDSAGNLEQLKLDLEDALSTLSDDERECIILKIYSGLTFREIAQVRNVPQGTAAAWYSRGLAKVRSQLEGYR